MLNTGAETASIGSSIVSINYFANYRSIYLVNEYFVILAPAKQADRLVKL